MQTLTAKQQRFIVEYMVDGNGARAAVAAGYGRAGAKVRAHRLTRSNPAVQGEIARLQALESDRLAIDRTAVIAGILAGIELAKERMDGATVIRGWAELGKLMGYFSATRHQVEVSAAQDAEIGRLERLSDAELVKLMAAEPATAG